VTYGRGILWRLVLSCRHGAGFKVIVLNLLPEELVLMRQYRKENFKVE